MELDNIIKKVAGLYLGTTILAVIVAILTLGEPFILLAGIGMLGLVTVLGDAIAEYGIEAVLNALYAERSKKESVHSLLEEIDGLFITGELKLKLKNQLSSKELITDHQTQVESLRTKDTTTNYETQGQPTITVVIEQ